MMSSEMGESRARSVAASRRWWADIVADDCLFIAAAGERAAKTAQRAFGRIWVEEGKRKERKAVVRWVVVVVVQERRN